MLQEIYKKKTPREHILERPNMYIGAINEIAQNEYFLDDEGTLHYEEISFIPGLVKIINEIIDNSVDIAIKTDFKICNKISVNISDDCVEIIDNGPGIPVKKSDDGDYIPYLCWGYAMSGSNFDDDENRKHIGMNGVGSYCTNVWSKKFIGISDDGENRYEIEFQNNASSYDYNITKSQSRGVTVKFWPDLERFKIDKIQKVYLNIIKLRLINLNVSFPKITFIFNGETLKVKQFSEYMKMFSDVSVIHYGDNGNYMFAIFPSYMDDFVHYSFVNGLFIKDGGTHINYIRNFFVTKITNELNKKYGIKRSEVANKLGVVAFLNNFANAKFNSQTKEKITNTDSELNAYWGPETWMKTVKQILKNEVIINPMIETFKMRDNYEKKQEIKKLNKNKNTKYEKYIKATKRKQYLMIVEGESALGSLMPAFGIENCGYFMLKGKPLNTWRISQQRFIANRELTNLYTIIKNENYEHIVYATDEDLDGIHIRSLLTGMIRMYLEEYQSRVGILETPILAVFKNDKLQRWVYSLDEDLKLKSGESSFYYKGLGSWEKEDLQTVIRTDGIDKMIVKLNFENSDASLEEWLGNNSEPRKKYILNNVFNIADV